VHSPAGPGFLTLVTTSAGFSLGGSDSTPDASSFRPRSWIIGEVVEAKEVDGLASLLLTRFGGEGAFLLIPRRRFPWFEANFRQAFRQRNGEESKTRSGEGPTAVVKRRAVNVARVSPQGTPPTAAAWTIRGVCADGSE